MQIDWLTVAAQILNFLILVYLLKRFLYKPVTAAMAQREERIAQRLRESREREEAAEHEREHLHERLQRLEARREAILDQAREEAEAEHRRLLEQAREEVEQRREHWHEQLRQERRQFLEDLRRHTTEGFQALTRRALRDLADDTLEDSMIRTLIRQLPELEQDTLGDLRTTDRPIEITTSFTLTDAQRQTIEGAVQRHLGGAAELEYRQSPELLCGIELGCGSRRLGWTLADYLDRFEDRLGAALDADHAVAEHAAAD
ncbi:hypothetical protein F2Q65_05170 [Thiohalocapsa marina]|uniref:ATP synthase subunit b n=1 Tax=Thiohalocapsa marina TaxID=424902 RepID=A0A5M8FMN6_9GAMM|nr:F0F1 ATP synthase subunit delta [Thiohalocapsa marina]KAA6186203.1 hypothetical protein F2Q65_05170 [Thiohalocapsa marina]